MRTFTIIWFGQLVSTIGSYMTEFALILWAWQVTGSATALALVAFFSRLLRIPMTLVAGLIVDRYNRKTLMILADAVAVLCTIAIAVLYFTNQLQIWHLYLTAAISGGAGQIQGLAYQTSLTQIIPSQQYVRANSMNSAIHYGSAILSPALAGILLPRIRLSGILLIDVLTFGIAIVSLCYVHIPQPRTQTESAKNALFNAPIRTLRRSFYQVWRQPSLRQLLIVTALFWFFHDLGSAIYDPMILARTNGSAQVLAGTASAAGIGGVTGAVLLSLWGGSKQRIHSLLGGFIGAGLSKTVFGLGRSPQVWLPAQFCSSLHFPLLSSSETALWMEKIAPEMQGRVFATNEIVLQVASAIAALMAGPLADRVFEPIWIADNRIPGSIHSVFGVGAGAGTALLYVLCSLAMICVGIVGFCLPQLRRIRNAPIVHEPG